ncbi:MAG TPA: YraN family protein [Candidatus Omnitrophota bacterium]|nr:YraN family protein [Candidatus Omnitrophota bacterium]
MAADPARLAARQRGRRAESLAALWLRLKGYRILARGSVTGRGTGAGEIDIVARRGRVVAFVEVKARPSRDEALEAITAAQRRRIMRAAETFLSRHPELAGCDMRFDAVLVVPNRLPRHISDAWRMDA